MGIDELNQLQQGFAYGSGSKLLSGYYHIDTPLNFNSERSITEKASLGFEQYLLEVPSIDEGHEPFAGLIELIRALAGSRAFDFEEFIDQWKGFRSIKEPLKARLNDAVYVRSEETLKEELYFEEQEQHRLITDLITELLKDRNILIYCSNAHNFPPSTWRFFENWDLSSYSDQIQIIFTLNKNQLFSNENQAAAWRRFTKKIDQRYGISKLPDQPIATFLNTDFDVVTVKQKHGRGLIERARIATMLAAALDITLLTDKLLDLAVASDTKSDEIIEIYSMLGAAHLFTDEFYSALNFYEQALDVAKSENDDVKISEAYRNMYVVTAHMHELEQTRDLASMSIKYAEKSKNEIAILNSYFFLTIWGEYFMHIFQGESYADLLRLLKKHDMLNYFGISARKSRLFIGASESFEATEKVIAEAIDVYRALENSHGLAAALHEHSVCYVELNNTEEAINALNASLEIRQSLGDPLGIIKAGNGLGYLYMIIGNQEKAFKSVMYAFQQLSFVRNWAEVGGTIFNMAMLYFNSRQFECAAKLFEAVVDIMYILNAQAIIFHTRSKVYTLLSICYFKSGQKASGLRTHNKAVQQGQSVLDSTDVEFYRCLSKGLADAAQSNYSDALLEFEQAKNSLNLEQETSRQLLSYYYAEKAIVYLSSGNEIQAKKTFESGMSLSVSLRLWRQAEWFQNALTNYDFPVSKLDKFSFQLHPIIQLAEHEADLRALQKRNTEFNFRRKIDELIYTTSSLDDIAKKFQALLHANLNVAVVSFNVLGNENQIIVSVEHNPNEEKYNLREIKSKLDISNSIIIDKKHTLFKRIEPFEYFVCIKLFSVKTGYSFETVVATDREDAPLNQRDFQLLDTLTKQVLMAFERIYQERQLNDQNLLLLRTNEMLEKSHLELEQTHQKTLHLQSQLVQAEKMAGLGTLVAGVSHEINNPLNFIAQGAVILEDEIKVFTNNLISITDDEDESTKLFLSGWQQSMQSHIDIVNEGSSRISSIIADLKHFARLDQADEDIYDLVAGVESTVRLIHAQFTHEIEFIVEKESTPKLRCYPAQINQVLMNLLTNAGDALCEKYRQFPEHHSKVVIRISCDDGNAVIEIADNGPGIQNSHLKKIFDPFFTTKEVGKGTGLGLSVTYSIVQQHNGSISVASETGTGTTFRLTLPITLDSENFKCKNSGDKLEDFGIESQRACVVDVVEQEVGVGQPPVVAINSSQPDEFHIMVIDDDRAVLKYTAVALTAPEYQIDTFLDGTSAMDFIEKNGVPDIVLCDVTMPGLSGFDVCEKLRINYSQGELPIILITANGDKQDKIKGFESGANDYLVKPYEKEELIARVRAQASILSTNRELSETRRKFAAVNQSLEKEVENRTSEVLSALTRLEAQHKQLSDQHNELQQMQNQLVHSEKMTSLGTLVAGIAHELNNPINFVCAGSDNLQNEIASLREYFFSVLDDSTPDDVREPFISSFDEIGAHMQGVLDGASRAKRVIANLHQFSRTEDSETAEEFDLAEGLESTVRLIKVNYATDIDFSLDIDYSPKMVGIPAKLNQVYMNLIVNACQALLEKLSEIEFGFRPRVEVKSFSDGEFATIKISDNGNGIPLDIQPKIFEPFYTTKSEGQGTGLGLAISHNIVTEHNGELFVESKLGKGTTFSIRLPVVRSIQ